MNEPAPAVHIDPVRNSDPATHLTPNARTQLVVRTKDLLATFTLFDARIKRLQTSDPQTTEQLQHLLDDKLQLLWIAANIGSKRDLPELTSSGEDLLEFFAPGDTRRAEVLKALDLLAQRKCMMSSHRAGFKQAVTRCEESILVTPTPRQLILLTRRWLALAQFHYGRFITARRTTDLHTTIQFAQKVLALTPRSSTSSGLQALRLLTISIGQRYLTLHDLHDLDLTIDLSQALVQLDTATRTLALQHLSGFLHMRCADEAAGAHGADLAVFLSVLDGPSDGSETGPESVGRAETALRNLPAGSTFRAGVLQILSLTLRDRYNALSDPSDLDASIDRAKQCVAATPQGRSDRPSYLQSLSVLHGVRFDTYGRLDDLYAGVESATEAVAATSLDDPDRAVRLLTLANHVSRRCTWFGGDKDLTTSIELLQDAVNRPLTDRETAAVVSTELCARLSVRYVARGDTADGEMAIECGTRGVDGHRERGEALTKLACAYSARYCRMKNIGDIDMAIALGEEGVAVTPVGHHAVARQAGNMSVFLSQRFDQLGELGGLSRAIASAREALAAVQPANPSRPAYLIGLSNLLMARFGRLGDAEDITEAIGLSTEGVDTIPADHPDRARHLNTLALLLWKRSGLTNRAEDLSTALAYMAEANRIGHTELHDQRAGRASNLCGMLLEKYNQIGNIDDLAAAFEWAGKSAAGTSVGYPRRGSRFGHTIVALCSRYARLGTLDDLTMSIKHGEKELAELPSDHLGRASCLNRISSLYLLQWDCLRSPDDLWTAIRYAHEAVSATPADHPELAPRLHNLSNALAKTGDESDLCAAAIYICKALDATKDRRRMQASVFESAASRFYAIYEVSGTTTFLDHALYCCNKALKLTPLLAPVRGQYELNLGTVLWKKYEQSNEPFYMFLASQMGRSAWECTAAGPATRLQAAELAVQAMVATGQYDAAGALVEEAVNLLPRLGPRTLQALDLENYMQIVISLPSVAGSLGLLTGKTAAHSLGSLELGRGVIAGRFMDYRSDVTELKRHFPVVHERFNDLRRELDEPPPATLEEDTYERYRDQRHRAGEALDDILLEIRELPGFARFQLPLSPDEMMAIASEGPIVIVNPYVGHGDAIIVTATSIRSVQLPGLDTDHVVDWMTKLRTNISRGPRSTTAQRNRRVFEVLLWLWDEVVHPVCTKLGLEPLPAEDDDALPHIWWIGVGPLAMAPFHAAGDHSVGSTRNMFCRAVSSYIPTIRALSFARQRAIPVLPHRNPKILLVTMPNTPGHPSLRQVTAEASLIASVAPAGSELTLLNEPSAAEVLSALPGHHIAHFACHGITNARSPSNSSLLLTKAHALDRLSARAIASRHIPATAQIAYLSACCTAVNASEDLQDESIHIAGAFQLAGFGHVLGTLWTTQDGVALSVAGEFYRCLFAMRDEAVGNEGVRVAFYRAVRSVRERWREQPVLWAGFIHSGA